MNILLSRNLKIFERGRVACCRYEIIRFLKHAEQITLLLDEIVKIISSSAHSEIRILEDAFVKRIIRKTKTYSPTRATRILFK